MQYWLLKTEPDTFSYDDLEQKASEKWDGVRNYQARNFIAQMKPGDHCIIYHSGKRPAAVGIAKVVSEPYPEPEANDLRWLCVDVSAVGPIIPFSLESMKTHPELSDIMLLKQSRLSVMPVSDKAFQVITGKIQQL
jgi:predicted RNA-binding protein with PUA-like domain